MEKNIILLMGFPCSMKKTLLSIIVFVPALLLAQDSPALPAFNESRLHTNKIGMTVLGGWALANIALSGALLKSSSGTTQKFHQMNIGWNAVNMVIAGVGYYGALNGDLSLDMAATVQEHEKIKRILLLNAGLDVAYITAGFWMREKAKTSLKSAQWKGFGNALLMNGGFLLLFDAVLYAVHQQRDTQLYELLSEIQMGSKSLGFTWRF